MKQNGLHFPTARRHGGGEQPWSVGYQAVREVAKADGSIGMLLGYHLLWSTIANVVGTPEQIEQTHELIIRNNYFVGGAVNPRDSDLKITSEGDNIIFNGAKFFNTGGVVSDLTVLEGVLEGTEDNIFAIVETKQPGIQFAHNWHNIGLRLTESGGVKIDNVRVPWSDALGWDANTKKPIGNILATSIQLVFSNFYLGIALGALDFASRYTKDNTRAWPFGGDNKASATEEFYILERYGNFFAHLRAAEALADRAGDRLSSLYNRYSTDRTALKPEERGEVAEWVASVKVVTTDTGLRVTSGIFEVTGARATSLKVGLDRFWRDIRTHTLHDPVAYKNRELGRFALLINSTTSRSLSSAEVNLETTGVHINISVALCSAEINLKTNTSLALCCAEVNFKANELALLVREGVGWGGDGDGQGHGEGSERETHAIITDGSLKSIVRGSLVLGFSMRNRIVLEFSIRLSWLFVRTHWPIIFWYRGRHSLHMLSGMLQGVAVLESPWGSGVCVPKSNREKL
ncbi:acyl-CoA dehydrogenase/oxidase [Aspergillus stella-maris]|uniref:acyl-CoA dehydrogenase/oxidase n=1 Tax=Aspergillus stella-maris TaxID=1810926 RepID=UPI003CCC9F6F